MESKVEKGSQGKETAHAKTLWQEGGSPALCLESRELKQAGGMSPMGWSGTVKWDLLAHGDGGLDSKCPGQLYRASNQVVGGPESKQSGLVTCWEAPAASDWSNCYNVETEIATGGSPQILLPPTNLRALMVHTLCLAWGPVKVSISVHPH